MILEIARFPPTRVLKITIQVYYRWKTRFEGIRKSNEIRKKKQFLWLE